MVKLVQRRLAGYFFALGAVAAAYYARWELLQWVGESLPPYILFFPTVGIVALVGGWESGLVATLATAILARCCILPAGPIALGDEVALLLFIGNNILFCAIIERYHRARNRVAEQVAERTAELARTNEELSRESARHRQALEVVRNSEEKLVKAFRASPDGVLISRLADGRFIEPSDKWLQMFGYTRA